LNYVPASKKCGLCVKTCKNNAIFQAPGKYLYLLKIYVQLAEPAKLFAKMEQLSQKKKKLAKFF
jgi:ferredoxin